MSVLTASSGAGGVNLTTGNITTQNLVPAGAATASSAVQMTMFGVGTLSVQITGTYTGALSAQVSTDGATWVTLGSTSTFTNALDGTTAATIASGAVGVYSIYGATGTQFVRVTALAAVTGTAVVTLHGAPVGGQSSGGGGSGSTTLTASELHIGEVGGHAAFPSATFNRPADTTQYAVGDLVANSTTAGSVVPMSWTAARVAQESFSIIDAKIITSSTTTNGIFRLHLYSVTPATITNGDNGAYSVSGSATWLGDIDVSVSIAATDGAYGKGVPNVGASISFALPSGTLIYGLLEARSAYTPTSGETFTVILSIIQN